MSHLNWVIKVLFKKKVLSNTAAFSHKYAIHSAMLGDDAPCAWSNLGLWLPNTTSYVQACQQLAAHLADQVQLSPTDHVLDLGCGHGASVLFWQQHYAVTQVCAVEVQPDCVAGIRASHLDCELYQASFLALPVLKPEYDVILCIDALYHTALAAFFNAIAPCVKPHARLGFHYLVLNERWAAQSWLQQKKYQGLLKAADISLSHLMSSCALQELAQQSGYQQIQIEVLTPAVFTGFSAYIAQLPPQQLKGMAGFKIKMTAKLCQQLYQDGLVDYVQVSMVKAKDASAVYTSA